MEQQTTLNILDSGACPECYEKHQDWVPYARPESKEIGVFCPICYTHFKDEELSFEEFDFDDWSS
jgi:hypothetical protein